MQIAKNKYANRAHVRKVETPDRESLQMEIEESLQAAMKELETAANLFVLE